MISISCFHKISSINSIRYENFDHYWMPSHVIDLCRFHSDKSFLLNHSRELNFPSYPRFCIFLSMHWGTDSLHSKKILQPVKELNFKAYWTEWAPVVSNRGCLCCQSNAEQWLRLISILMNANWHICYGGLAVQTLQLAWLINYPPAGGNGRWGKSAGMWGVGGERKRNKKTVLKLHSLYQITELCRLVK